MAKTDATTADWVEAHIELGRRYLWLLSAARDALSTGDLENLRTEVELIRAAHPEDFEGEGD